MAVDVMGPPGLLLDLRGAEITDLCPAVRRQEDVGRFDIPMHDPSSCAACRPRAMSAVSRSASASGRGPSVMRSAKVPPGIYSRIRYRVPFGPSSTNHIQ